jgi:hypothetical protein
LRPSHIDFRRALSGLQICQPRLRDSQQLIGLTHLIGFGFVVERKQRMSPIDRFTARDRQKVELAALRRGNINEISFDVTLPGNCMFVRTSCYGHRCRSQDKGSKARDCLSKAHDRLRCCFFLILLTV